MAVQQDHTLLLDQLQEQVNLVLEHTGRLFAAARATPKVAPIAQAARLRHAMPNASSRFHEALDKLEDELQMAKLVMRRDLAVWREQNDRQVIETPMQLDDVPAEVTEAQDIAKEDPESEVNNDEANVKPATDSDATMLDADSHVNGTAAEDTKNTAAEEKPVIQPEEKAEVKPAETKPEAEPSSTAALQIDTSQPAAEGDHQENSDDRQPPDTADLDSLFNDPLSAGGPNNSNDDNADPAEAGSNDAFNFEDAGASDFDFDSFSANLNSAGAADNDNISALLPGLQDYANTQPNSASDMDFNALFGDMGDEQEQGGAAPGGGGGGEQQRDPAFDDLLDLANFDSGNGADGSGNANDDLDFDSFFG